MSYVRRAPSGRWRAVYLDPQKRERSRTFSTKPEARRFLAEQDSAVNRGSWIDPVAGRTTVGEYYPVYMAGRLHRPTTSALYETDWRLHVEPFFGNRPMSSIVPSEIQGWVKGKSEVLAPGTVRRVYGLLAALLKSATADRLIPYSPCVRIVMPKAAPREVRPLSLDQVDALHAAVPERYRAIVTAAVGLGLRQGEILGLTRPRVRFLEREVIVAEQLTLMPGAGPYLAPPKTAKSVRTVPLPRVVADELAAHIAAHPDAGPLDLVFAEDDGAGIRRTRFHSKVWTPALAAAELPAGTKFHQLRHTYASLLIDAGEHPKVIQERLGHATITETMDTSGHLFPASEDRTRQVIDDALGRRHDAGREEGEQHG